MNDRSAKSFDMTALERELRARETSMPLSMRPPVESTSTTPPSRVSNIAAAASGAAIYINPAMSHISSRELAEELKRQQKVVYGIDDRTDFFEITDQSIKDAVEGVAALFRSADVVDNGDNTSSLPNQTLFQSHSVCGVERFGNQPTGAFCTGFLVAPDIVATAAHCIDLSDLATTRFVFGYRMTSSNNATTTINNSDIYQGISLIGRVLDSSTGSDWALVKLDRVATGRPVAAVASHAKVPDDAQLHVIGHPVGLPVKYAPNAEVRDDNPDAFFVANLDTYGGNSGSPVYNSQTGEVEGILVRGENDFRWIVSGSTVCRVSMVCPTTGCRGEDCTRSAEFRSTLNAALSSDSEEEEEG